MKITGFVRAQLIIFSIVTVISIVAMAVYYIRIPQMVGIGSYTVKAQMDASGGLYKNANVSFRGVNVGKVTGMRLTEKGVEAELRIDSGTHIPDNSVVSVRSVSAVGEQFVEFSPPAENVSSHSLGDDATVEVTDLPVEISSMLDQADALLNQVGDTKLRDLMDEAFAAFNGTGPQLQRLLDSMALFVAEADKNVDTAIALVDQAGPILETQNQTAAQIRSWTRDVTTFTDTLRAHRPEITDILREGPGTANAAQKLFSDMNESLPLAVSNLRVDARTMALYLPNLRQTIVLYPRVLAALLTAVNTGSSRYGANVSFTLGFQDPPACTVGFLPPDQWRFPSAQDARDLPPGQLCRLPQNAQSTVRGARNFPCVEYPGRRAPTPEECATGYKPDADQNLALPNGFPGTDLPKASEVQPRQPAGRVVPGSAKSYDSEPAVYATTYDPDTGEFIGPDGKKYTTGELSKETEGQKTQWYDLITKTVEN
ncbi:MCE family protein [Gordonia sp. VNK21]|uniref:MCE family protein n=1 Tax=Gordonia sp. VNK21 TaxID=3382483 RepID=UPI0038D46CD3